MKTIKLSNASRSLAEYAAELGDDIVVLMEHKKPVAAIVPLRGVDAESVALSGHPGFLRIIARSRDEVRHGRTLSLEAMKAAFATEAPNPLAAVEPRPTNGQVQRAFPRGSRLKRGR